MKIAVHMLVPYSPSNPNRDELGMPKTATVGGVLRQRISSQSLKRAWRLSEIFHDLNAETSVRTRALGEKVRDKVLASGGAEKLAETVGKKVRDQFGKADRTRPLHTSEVVIMGHEEWDAALSLAEGCGKEGKEPSEEELKALPQMTTSIDVAMFGRMRASAPSLNVDAAVAVAHALTTNKTTIEADFWTAVDDLNEKSDDAGAGGMGEREFGSGVYYVYAIVDKVQLVRNLDGDEGKADMAIDALISAMATTTPGGHRSSFAHHTYASYIVVERADRVAGNLMLPAFESPAEGTRDAIEKLKSAFASVSKAYGIAPPAGVVSVPDGVGSLPDLLS